MNEDTLKLFKTLTEIPAAPGFEKDIGKFVRSELEKYTNEIIQDRFGSIFGVVRGDEQGPRVMVTGHLDEVGFMVTKITDNGMIRFEPLGKWWSQVLLAQRVQIITKKGPIIGVIGSTPPHLLSEAQRVKPAEISQMFIDIGADDRQDAENMGIQPGLQIVPVGSFEVLSNPKKILAKAWDNRYGVGLAVELLKEVHTEQLPNILFSGAVVQEERRKAGAVASANLIQPDICYGLDASPANDTTGDKSQFGQLGKGTLLRILGKHMITHQGIKEFILDTAESNHIPYQYFVAPGTTDAEKIQLHGIGVPSAVIGVCSRYVHTSSSILHIDDYEAAKELLVKLVKTTDKTNYEHIIANG
ncbi:M42 family metallopeptidase [Chengkuizengella axinellae]|uniref:M42 family metallopeptidase n=1 Tax=Chengkuizengella axinellae TaxID=3064388 RepID=A0ABT9IZM1_9BACL|nr:M42 family metallopeptidase [Chengkuizengella sp. 2205SS18-9]MDP5274825.1 M42 family metallopeptidase [Chengkuizengella sp. 2205SS18-9]